MKPINSRAFGSKAGNAPRIAIKFYDDDSAVVTGWIMKQVGSFKFKVTDGTVTKFVRLAQTTSELTALTAGTGDDAALRPDLGTIEIDEFGGGTENVAKIMSKAIITIDGARLKYDVATAAAAAGEGDIALVANAAPTVSNAIADQVGTVAGAFSFTFADDAFADANMDELTYSATENGGALTVFAFDAETRTFTKEAGDGAAAVYTMVVTADDGTATITDTFTITLS